MRKDEEGNMRKKSTKLGILAVLILILGLMGCAGQEEAEEIVLGENEALIVDSAGREVVVPTDAEDIAILYAYAGHVTALLDRAEDLVAVVSGTKRDTLMQEKIPNVDDLPEPYAAGAINIEELILSDPDIIFVRTENISDQGEIDKLDSCGIPYVVIEYSNIEEQLHTIEIMGIALDAEDRSEAYIQYYEETIAMVEERTADLAEEDKVLAYHSVNEVTRTDIIGTISYEVLDIAGIKNVVTEEDNLSMDNGKAYTTVEQIYLWDPDVILSTEPTATDYFNEEEVFAALDAVVEGEVYQLPVGISRFAHTGSIETPLAILYISQLFYPELYEDIDMDQEIYDFYLEFFDVELSEEDLACIYAGEGMRIPKASVDVIY